MKKLHVVLLIIVFVCGIFTPSLAETESVFSAGDWEYTVMEDGTVEIKGFTSKEKEVVIPEVLDGKPVTSIGDYALQKEAITSILIPDSITTIGDEAFGECRSLNNITISDGVKIIGNKAFYWCMKLESITIPDSVTEIGSNPFARCYNLKKINVSPDHPCLATIDGVLFSKKDKRLVCYPSVFNDKSYSIPDGIEEIGDNAFDSCENLTSIMIPQSVKKIGDWAFNNCKYLTGITIPDGVTSIGEGTFSNCYDLTDITIPDSVTEIGKAAFLFCDKLSRITIPDSVTTLGALAFEYCGELASITIPDSVTTIEGNPFPNCYGLEEVIVSPDHPYLEKIDGALFSKTDRRLICLLDFKENYAIPGGTEKIGDYAFYSERYISDITIPDSVTSIGECAFNGSGLTSITIPGSVAIIGDAAFGSCRDLTSVKISDNVTSIEDGAFNGCDNLTSVTIPDSVTTIGTRVFAYCNESLTVTVGRDSYAKQYCEENGINYTYADANDWLNK